MQEYPDDAAPALINRAGTSTAPPLAPRTDGRLRMALEPHAMQQGKPLDGLKSLFLDAVGPPAGTTC
jgi:hypothetical protein